MLLLIARASLPVRDVELRQKERFALFFVAHESRLVTKWPEVLKYFTREIRPLRAKHIRQLVFALNIQQSISA